MEEHTRLASDRAKVYALLYSILNIFNAIIFFSTSYLLTATSDQRLRGFTLMWISALMIAVVSIEMLRALFEAGGNPLTISLIGVLNVAFVGMQLAVYADIIVYDVIDTPLALLIIYLILAAFGVLVLVIWMTWKYIRHRKQEKPS